MLYVGGQGRGSMEMSQRDKRFMQVAAEAETARPGTLVAKEGMVLTL